MIFVEETDERFYIAPSTIPNAGHGCFTKTHIKRGDWLDIIGVYVKTGGLADQCTEYAKRYKFAGSPKLDAKIVPMGFGGMVNHSDDPKLRNCELIFDKGINKRSQHAGQVVYKFIRDVLPNEEVIGNYGQNISEEVNKIAANLGFLVANKSEIDKLLEHDLYNLNAVLNNI
jgi:hypothetical protein